jgi:hypothetical protein
MKIQFSAVGPVASVQEGLSFHVAMTSDDPFNIPAPTRRPRTVVVEVEEDAEETIPEKFYAAEEEVPSWSVASDPVAEFIEYMKGERRRLYTGKEFQDVVTAAVEAAPGTTNGEMVKGILQAAGLELDKSKYLTRRQPVRGISSSPGGNIWADPSMRNGGGAGINPHTGTAAGGMGGGQRWDAADPKCLGGKAIAPPVKRTVK